MRNAMTSIGVVVTVMVLAGGCMSVDGMIGDTLTDIATRPAEQALERSMSQWTDEMAFRMTYMQVFFLGGYGAGFENFEEGQGAAWEVTSTDGTEEATFIGERALLRRNPDGTSWWYLRFETEDDPQEFEYEVRVDEEYDALEIYLRDPETGEIRHRVFETDPADADAEDEAPAGDDAGEDWDEGAYGEDDVVFDEDLGEYREERVTVTVQAGTYEADRLVYEYVDEETGDSVEYRWWLTDEVPGEVVLYEWEDTSAAEEGMLRGELIWVRLGYTTKFGAF